LYLSPKRIGEKRSTSKTYPTVTSLQVPLGCSVLEHGRGSLEISDLAPDLDTVRILQNLKLSNLESVLLEYQIAGVRLMFKSVVGK